MSTKKASKKKPGSKGGGRTTAKGTQPAKKPKVARNVPPGTPDRFDDQTAGKVGRSQGKVARPITHNRGNR